MDRSSQQQLNSEDIPRDRRSSKKTKKHEGGFRKIKQDGLGNRALRPTRPYWVLDAEGTENILSRERVPGQSRFPPWVPTGNGKKKQKNRGSLRSHRMQNKSECEHGKPPSSIVCLSSNSHTVHRKRPSNERTIEAFFDNPGTRRTTSFSCESGECWHDGPLRTAKLFSYGSILEARFSSIQFNLFNNIAIV